MKSELQRYFLEFNEPFSIAHGTRAGTDLVLLRLEHLDVVAWGEASLPPYLPETQDTVCDFIEEFLQSGIDVTAGYDVLHERLMHFKSGNFAAKACLDIALCNWYSRQKGLPVWKWLGLNDQPLPLCTYTIGMGTADEIREKVRAAHGFPMLKVKLGGAHDLEIMDALRSITDKPVCVDANQGWKSKEFALEMLMAIHQRNVVFAEQPLPKALLTDMVWLKERSPLPLFADESVQVPEDVSNVAGGFHGVNVKLMKCGGITEGLKMIKAARKAGMKVLIGSMSETSCGIMAAAQLSSLADFTDLDGPLLTKNNPFECPVYKDGRILIS